MLKSSWQEFYYRVKWGTIWFLHYVYSSPGPHIKWEPGKGGEFPLFCYCLVIISMFTIDCHELPQINCGRSRRKQGGCQDTEKWFKYLKSALADKVVKITLLVNSGTPSFRAPCDNPSPPWAIILVPATWDLNDWHPYFISRKWN